jgi:hypothetical protein
MTASYRQKPQQQVVWYEIKPLSRGRKDKRNELLLVMVAAAQQQLM